MSQAQQLVTVNFHGTELFVVDHNNEPFAPMKPIVEGMGLAWGAQQQKLSSNKERWGILIFDIPTQSGVQQAVCMPLRKLPAFFASISVNRVHQDLRATIVLFQNECDDALWRYWTGQRVQRESIAGGPALPTITPSTAEDRAPLRALVHAWSQTSGQPHQALWPQVKAHFQLSRIDDLPAEWIPDALAFVQSKIDEQPKALPAPKPDYALTVHSASLDGLHRIVGDHIREIRKLLGDIHAIEADAAREAGNGARSEALLHIRSGTGKQIEAASNILDGLFHNLRASMMSLRM